MSGIAIEWEGLDALIEKLEGYSGRVEENVSRVYADVGAEAKAVMDDATPVETGYLKSRNNVEKTEDGFDLGNDAEYAGWVNGGTQNQSAQPFFDVAVEHARQELKQLLPKTLNVK
jgi:HK97 gp10 family phage protein